MLERLLEPCIQVCIIRCLFPFHSPPQQLPFQCLLLLSLTTPPPSSSPLSCVERRGDKRWRIMEDVGRERLVDKPSMSRPFSFSISFPHRVLFPLSLSLSSLFFSLLFLSRHNERSESLTEKREMKDPSEMKGEWANERREWMARASFILLSLFHSISSLASRLSWNPHFIFVGFVSDKRSRGLPLSLSPFQCLIQEEMGEVRKGATKDKDREELYHFPSFLAVSSHGQPTLSLTISCS